MTTTGMSLDGYRVVQNLGIIRGTVVRSRSLVGTIGADPLHRPLRFAQGDSAAVGSVASGVSP